MGFLSFLKSDKKEKVEDFFKIDIHDIYKYNPEYLGEEVNDFGTILKKYRLVLDRPELGIFDKLEINGFDNNSHNLIFKSNKNVLSKELREFIKFCTNKFGLDSSKEGEITNKDLNYIRQGIFSRMWTKNNVWVDNNSNRKILLTLFSVKMNH